MATVASTVTGTGLQLRKKAQRPCLCEDKRKTNLQRFTVMSNGGRCYMGGGGDGQVAGNDSHKVHMQHLALHSARVLGIFTIAVPACQSLQVNELSVPCVFF